MAQRRLRWVAVASLRRELTRGAEVLTMDSANEKSSIPDSASGQPPAWVQSGGEEQKHRPLQHGRAFFSRHAVLRQTSDYLIVSLTTNRDG